jgi:hypothetical protein
MHKSGMLWMLCIAFIPGTYAQDPILLQQAENELNLLFNTVAATPDDGRKLRLNDSIVASMARILETEGSFEHPFQTITSLGKITSPDNKVRIYTWNLPSQDASNRYFGFVQIKNTPGSQPVVRRMIDKSGEITDPANRVLTPEQWYGMLVYDIIVNKFREDTYYTLLGYDADNLFLSRKIIDVLSLNEAGEPEFGKPIFLYQKRNQCRILFEYSAKVQMSLRWNKASRRIVFDHLSPSKPSYKGNYQYYGPDFSFDALYFENGMWILIEDVDVRNTNE